MLTFYLDWLYYLHRPTQPEGAKMSQAASDLRDLRKDFPNHPELHRMALNLIAPGVRSERAGC